MANENNKKNQLINLSKIYLRGKLGGKWDILYSCLGL